MQKYIYLHHGQKHKNKAFFWEKRRCFNNFDDSYDIFNSLPQENTKENTKEKLYPLQKAVDDSSFFGAFDDFSAQGPVIPFQQVRGTLQTPSPIVSSSLPRQKSIENYARFSLWEEENGEILRNKLSLPFSEKREQLSTGEIPQYSRGFHLSLGNKLADSLQANSEEAEKGEFSYRNNFAALVAEDGSDFSQLQKIWTSGNGVFQANHNTHTIGNSTLQEYLRESNSDGLSVAKNTVENNKKENIKRITELEKSKNVLLDRAKNHIDTSNPSLLFVNKEDIQNLRNFVKKSSLKGIKEFAQGKDPSLSPSEIKDIMIEIEFLSTSLFSEERKFLRRYFTFLNYQQEIFFIKEKQAVLNQMKQQNVSPNFSLKIQKLYSKKESLEKQIEQEKAKQNSDKKILATLKYEQEITKSRLNYYEKFRTEHNTLHAPSGEEAYYAFFDTPLSSSEKNGQMNGPLHTPYATIPKLKKYYDWIETKMFIDGVPKPANHDVHAFLLSSAYRGEISPSAFHIFLANLQKENLLQKFYDAVDKKSISEFSEFAKFDTTKTLLPSLSRSFSREKKLGDSALANPFKKEFQREDTMFRKEYGFSKTQAFSVWESMNAVASDPSSRDRQGNLIILGNQVPLEEFFAKDGSVNNTPAMKQLLSGIISTVDFEKNPEALGKKQLYEQLLSGNWNPKNKELITLVKILKDSFSGRKMALKKANFDNPASSQKDVMNQWNHMSGGVGMEALEFIGDELMDGNLMYWGFAAATLWLAGKNSWLKNGLLWGSMGLLGNAVVEDMTGYDGIGMALEAIKGTDAVRAKSPAYWATYEMKNSGMEFENETVSERAGVVLGGCNLADTLAWYDESRKLIAENNPQAYDNELMPAPLRENLQKILENSGYQSGALSDNKKAKIAFDFFDKYLQHVDISQNNRMSGGSAEGGYKFLANNFINNPTKITSQKTYMENGVPKKGYKLNQVYVELTDPKTIAHMTEQGSPALEWMKESGEKAEKFVKVVAREYGGDSVSVMKKMNEITLQAKNLGFDIIGMTEREIKFRDSLNSAMEWSVKKVKDGWEVVSTNGAVAWTGKKLDGAWSFIKTQAKKIPNIPSYIKNSSLYLNSFLAGTNMDIYDGEAEMNGTDVDLLKSVENLRILKSIKNTYGILTDEMARDFISSAAKNADVQKQLKKIAASRKSGSSKILNKDIVMYFFGWGGYGIGAVSQMGIDIVETVSSLVNRGAQAVVGVFSDDAKAFLMEYDPSKLARIFPRDDIDGKESFRSFVQKKSRESFDGTSEIITTHAAVQKYVADITEAILSKKALSPDIPFLELLNSAWNSSVVSASNWFINSINTTEYKDPKTGKFITYIPEEKKIRNIKDWNSKISPRPELAKKIVFERIKQRFKDETFVQNLFSELTKKKGTASITSKDIDEKLLEIMDEELRKLDWRII